MANKTIRLGVVGCGAHAQIAHLPIIMKNSACQLIAICDTDVRKLDHLGTKYDIPNRYQDFQEMLEDESVEALTIVTPNYLHAPMTISALKYGKHVLCENPMATNLIEATEMIATAEKTGQKLCIAMNNRLRPDVEMLRSFIQEGELGNIYYIKAGWLIGSSEWILSPWRQEHLKSGGGAFLSLGTTILDMSLFLLKNKTPSSIFASVHKKGPTASVEDTAMCIINFLDGTLLTIEVGWSLILEQDFVYCNIFGKKGAALLNPLRVQKELHNELCNVTPSITHTNPHLVAYEKQTGYFINHILYNHPLPITHEDGLLMARITEAFYRSVNEQQLIQL